MSIEHIVRDANLLISAICFFGLVTASCSDGNYRDSVPQDTAQDEHQIELGPGLDTGKDDDVVLCSPVQLLTLQDELQQAQDEARVANEHARIAVAEANHKVKTAAYRPSNKARRVRPSKPADDNAAKLIDELRGENRKLRRDLAAERAKLAERRGSGSSILSETL